MLVLTRKKGESLFLGDNIEVTVVEFTGKGVRLGIIAPKNLPVVRSELLKEGGAENILRRAKEAEEEVKDSPPKPLVPHTFRFANAEGDYRPASRCLECGKLVYSLEEMRDHRCSPGETPSA